jgi:hypothetical protein
LAARLVRKYLDDDHPPIRAWVIVFAIGLSGMVIVMFGSLAAMFGVGWWLTTW